MDIDLKTFLADPAARVHFIGCEGAGTKPLRRIFDELGFRTSGSDLTLNGHRSENLPEVPDGSRLLVVYSSAVAPDNPELVRARELGAQCILRGEALGLAAGLFPCVIAVSGSHGKTSVTAMVVHILREAGLEPGFLIGGKIRSNELTGSAGAGRIFVCEADESDGTHTAIHSTLAVVTNVEDDHVWNFASPECLVRNFRQFAAQGKQLLAPALPMFADHPAHTVFRPPDEIGRDPRFRSFAHYAQIDLEIAVEAVTVTGLLSRADALSAGASFPGVGRRMEPHGVSGSFLLYEDYAHHPTELAESLGSFRRLFPGRPLKVIFQPHRYARLERYFEDFVRVLKQADEVFVTPVFAAWTASGKVDSRQLAETIGPNAHLLSGSWPEMAHRVRAEVRTGDLIAVIGAGDVREILEPLQRELFGEVGLILPAGGSSRRYGSGNKLLEKINGVPVFIHTLRALTGGKKYPVVLPVPEAQKAEFERLLGEFPCGDTIRVVPGGSTRTESVRNALRALPPEVGVVAVHDAARPLVTHAVLDDCVNAALVHGGAVSAHPQTDTLKEADASGKIIRTVPRENLWSVQTPQVFRRDLLEKACAQAADSGRGFTDDAAAVEAFTEIRPVLVKNTAPNPKLTYPDDLVLLRKLCGPEA
ncbi:MAG: 2-C-methyl-D-erythritol 4-phosphate cytidylyltransferase [Lentisphaeria bacterium]|nr:2-C-methyl-D-erythritol 4-phosphate cytidylyltransferase [Lentisphaeria bacterium]